MKHIIITLALVFSFLNIKSGIVSLGNAHTETNEKEVEVQKHIVSEITGTVYNLEVGQCDVNPYETADGTVIKKSADVNKLRYVALSRDLMKDEYRAAIHTNKNHWRGKIQFGDTITVVSDNEKLCGKWIVRDVLNKRFSKRMDFLQDKGTGFYGKWDNITIIKEES